MIGGGLFNTANGRRSVIGGGEQNTTESDYSTVGGGAINIAYENYSTVPGGAYNEARGEYSFAAGQRAKVLHNHDGTFVWADHTNADFSSTGPDQFLIRATGGVGIGVNDPSTSLDIVNQIRIRGGGPAANRVLSSIDATGTAVWRDISSIASDDDWDKEPSGGTTEVLETHGAWGIARDGNYTAGRMYGSNRNTHINLGVTSTTGETGQNRSFVTVSGGSSNEAAGEGSTISGGLLNDAIGHYSIVAGGYENKAYNPAVVSDESRFAAIVGGYQNDAMGRCSFVGAGNVNKAYDDYCVIGGGSGNWAGTSGSPTDARFATVGGGLTNKSQADYSTIGGGGYNSALSSYATIAGGDSNSVSASYGTIAGGDSNMVYGEGATVGGGKSNVAGSRLTFIGGGTLNTAGGIGSTIAGGSGNITSNDFGSVGGGLTNEVVGTYGTISGGGRTALGDATTNNAVYDNYGTIGGGGNNKAGTNNGSLFDAIYATIGGGVLNRASASYSTVSGGGYNTISGSFGTEGGGYKNRVTGDYGTIGGGDTNTVTGAYGTIGGGDTNLVTGIHGTVGGGMYNTAYGASSFIGGGDVNRVQASAYRGTIAGGNNNTIIDTGGAIVGGILNQTSGFCSFIGGGKENSVSGRYAAIPGGYQNIASKEYSFAAGYKASADDNCSFVWSDCCSGTAFSSQGNNTFNVRADGGTFIYSKCDLSSGVKLTNGSSAWVTVSDSALKRNIRPVDGTEILQKIAGLPIARWSYKAQDPGIEHIGPMAQDFYKAFGLGEDDKTISTIDPDGIALAAVKELYKLQMELNEKVQKIEQLEKQLGELDKLKAQMAELQSLVETLLAKQNKSGNAAGDLAATGQITKP